MNGEEGCPKKWNQKFILGWAELVAEDRTIRENATIMRGTCRKIEHNTAPASLLLYDSALGTWWVEWCNVGANVHLWTIIDSPPSFLIGPHLQYSCNGRSFGPI